MHSDIGRLHLPQEPRNGSGNSVDTPFRVDMIPVYGGNRRGITRDRVYRQGRLREKSRDSQSIISLGSFLHSQSAEALL